MVKEYIVNKLYKKTTISFIILKPKFAKNKYNLRYIIALLIQSSEVINIYVLVKRCVYIIEKLTQTALGTLFFKKSLL